MQNITKGNSCHILSCHIVSLWISIFTIKKKDHIYDDLQACEHTFEHFQGYT